MDVAPDPARGRPGRRAIATAGFRAVRVDDLARVFTDCGVKATTVPEVPGFAGLVRFDDIERATKKVRSDEPGPRPELFEERLERLKVPIVTARGLTAEGRERALVDLKHLADETPPAGLSAVEIGNWRRDRVSVRDAAQDAAVKRPTKTRPKAKSEARADG